LQKKLSAFAVLLSSNAYVASFVIFLLLSTFQFGKIMFGSDVLISA